MEMRDDLGEVVSSFSCPCPPPHLSVLALKVALPASSPVTAWLYPCFLSSQVSLTTETLN